MRWEFEGRKVSETLVFWKRERTEKNETFVEDRSKNRGDRRRAQAQGTGVEERHKVGN